MFVESGNIKGIVEVGEGGIYNYNSSNYDLCDTHEEYNGGIFRSREMEVVVVK